MSMGLNIWLKLGRSRSLYIICLFIHKISCLTGMKAVESHTQKYCELTTYDFFKCHWDLNMHLETFSQTQTYLPILFYPALYFIFKLFSPTYLSFILFFHPNHAESNNLTPPPTHALLCYSFLSSCSSFLSCQIKACLSLGNLLNKNGAKNWYGVGQRGMKSTKCMSTVNIRFGR